MTSTIVQFAGGLAIIAITNISGHATAGHLIPINMTCSICMTSTIVNLARICNEIYAMCHDMFDKNKP